MTPVIVVSAWFACQRLGPRRQWLFAALWALHVAASLIFWLGRDLPLALAANRCWPEAKAAAAMIDRDRDRVAADEQLAENLGEALTLELDRRVRALTNDGVVPPGTKWLILPEKAAAPKGYAQHARLGSDVLWRQK